MQRWEVSEVGPFQQEAAAKASKGAARAEGFELDLQESCGAWLTPSTLLLALAAGEMVLLNLEVTAGIVTKLKLQKANDAPRASCCCRLGGNFVFLGSWLGDSLLLHIASSSHKVHLYAAQTAQMYFKELAQ